MTVDSRAPSDEHWLICERRAAKKEYRYHVTNLPRSISKSELVRLTKLRWRVERDYQEMKGEIGLDHFEGRTWRGFHHHATLCAVAHGFLAIQRQLSPTEQNAMDVVARATSASALSPRTHRPMSALSPTA